MNDTIDTRSATWRVIQRVAEKAHAEAQSAVNNRHSDERETNFYRGRLSFAAEILANAKEPVATPPAETKPEARARDKSGYR